MKKTKTRKNKSYLIDVHQTVSPDILIKEYSNSAGDYKTLNVDVHYVVEVEKITTCIGDNRECVSYRFKTEDINGVASFVEITAYPKGNKLNRTLTETIGRK